MKKLIFISLLISLLSGCIVNHNYYLYIDRRDYGEKDGYHISGNKYMDNELFIMMYIDTLKHFDKIKHLRVTIENDTGKIFKPKRYEANNDSVNIKLFDERYSKKVFDSLPEISKKAWIGHYPTWYNSVFAFDDIKSKYIVVFVDIDAITNTGEMINEKKKI